MSVRDNENAISAHGGGELVDLKAPTSERAALGAHAAKLASVTLNARDIADLEMLASGAFSPLTGFMGEADYTRARDEMRLASSVPWSIPITLGVDEATAKSLKTGKRDRCSTTDEQQAARDSQARGNFTKSIANLRRRTCSGTSEDAHPGAKNVTSMPVYCLMGKGHADRGEIPGRTFLEFTRASRSELARRSASVDGKKIVAFQTRNPTHRAHSISRKRQQKSATA